MSRSVNRIADGASVRLAMNDAPARDAVAPGSARVRALFVVNSLHVGGSEAKAVRLVNAMLERDLAAGIAHLNESCELREQLDARAHVWPLRRRGKFSAAAVRRLRHIIRQHGPDVVFSVNTYPALYVALATAGLRRRPLTVGLLNTTTFAREDEWRRTFYRPFLRRFDRIIFGCELQRAEWSRHLRLEEARSTVIYNGIDVDWFAPVDFESAMSARRRLGIPAESFVLGTVGRFAAEKNQGALIETLAELRQRGIDARLLLVGDGPKRAELQQLVERRSLQACVAFPGTHRDVRPFLSAMDVFVLPSHTETFSNAALEAMAMSKPVILSRVGGAAEMVRDDEEGFTVPLESLGIELHRLLMRLHDDAGLRLRLGQAARARVVRCFSLQRMVDGFCALTNGSPRDPGLP